MSNYKRGDWVRATVWERSYDPPKVETIDTIMLDKTTLCWQDGWSFCAGISAWNVRTCTKNQYNQYNQYNGGFIIKKLCPRTISNELKEKYKLAIKWIKKNEKV